ncbi:hypothetical protein [Arenimonas caeni]|jgi:transposase-like protein|uniref:hypothetical protein n=1 Tax=Arenimonas caeni TaxID=2058085 RepID=UPI002A3619BB|nr:hypothetical protein [Arenimonas caeni]MDY0021092.1 hypothetical protein [Arenimonas caeni]
MATKVKERETPWCPPAVDGIDVNGCRSPRCENFGIAPTPRPSARRVDAEIHGYTRYGTGDGPLGNIALKCGRCGSVTTMLNNAAIAEELARFAIPVKQPACRTATCENAGIAATTHPDRYHQFGRTNAGSPRWRCRACGSTCSASSRGGHRLRLPEASVEVLRLLVNKVPMRRICEVSGLHPKVLYDRISRLSMQLRALSAHYESVALSGTSWARLHLNTDRQTHTLNWGTALERQPIMLLAIATADVTSGYVVAQHLNYDPDANPRAMELLAYAAGDPQRRPVFRKYARVWLPYQSADATGSTQGKSDSELRVPGVGGIVHENYTMAAHLQALKPWVAQAAYVQFSLDLDPLLDRLCLLTFSERVRGGTLDAYLVRINKDMTVAQRRQALAEAQGELDRLRSQWPQMADSDLIRAILVDRLEETRAQALPPGRVWIRHPYPTMSEPQRSVQPLTDDGRRPDGQLVAGMARATLRALDRYFMQVRRKINILERPIHSASASGRAWHGYNAYSPRVVAEMLDIFRVVYNFHLRGQDGKTPAQRLGLAERPMSLAELCANSPVSYSLPPGRK